MVHTEAGRVSRGRGGGAKYFFSRTKMQPKEEVFGADIPRTSGGHSRGYPGPKLRSGRSKSWKNKHFSADVRDPKARTSTTLRGFQKLRSEKLRAEFSFPKHGAKFVFLKGIFHSFHRHICAIPYSAPYHEIIARYSRQRARMSFAMPSLQVSRGNKRVVL